MSNDIGDDNINSKQSKMMKFLERFFLLFWSVGSGYGILFAIESYLWDLFGLDAYFWKVSKGIIAIIFGSIIGLIHFYITVLKVSNDTCTKDENSQYTNLKSFPLDMTADCTISEENIVKDINKEKYGL